MSSPELLKTNLNCFRIRLTNELMQLSAGGAPRREAPDTGEAALWRGISPIRGFSAAATFNFDTPPFFS